MSSSSNISSSDIYKSAAQLIHKADTLLIVAGAGFGVDSGLPDFRGKNGFYTAYPQFESSGYSFYDVANPRFFFENPRVAWGFYAHRYHLYQKTEPHSGYLLLKKWVDLKSGFVVTTNVDNHFVKSGFNINKVFEIHGSIYHLQCMNNCNRFVFDVTSIPEVDESDLSAIGDLPVCHDCNGLARPNILMFNDANWNPERSDRQRLRYDWWYHKSIDKNIVVLEIGVGTEIPTLRYWLPHHSRIRINPNDCNALQNGITIREGAKSALEKIDCQLKKIMDDL